MTFDLDRIHSPAIKFIASTAFTILACAVFLIIAFSMSRKNASITAKAEQYSIECVAQSEHNEELARMLEPEYESELLSRAAIANDYVNSEDYIFKIKN